MEEIILPIEPHNFFVDFVSGNRIERGAPQFNVRLTPILKNWAEFALDDIDRPGNSMMSLLSLAVQYGATAPVMKWNLPIEDFDEINRVMSEQMMEGSPDHPGPMPMDFEQGTLNYPNSFQMNSHTLELIRQYKKALKLSRSEVVRICIAVAFHWYDDDVFYDKKAERWKKQTDLYVDNLKKQLDYRVKWTRDNGGDL